MEASQRPSCGAPSRHERGKRIAPDPLRFVLWDHGAQLERGQSLAKRVKLADGTGYAAGPELARVGKPRDSAPQAVQGVLGRATEAEGEFLRDCHVLHAKSEQRRVLEREPTKDAGPRLNQVASRIVRHRQGFDRGPEQLEGPDAERDHETVLRAEQAVHGAGGGADFLAHTPDRERLQAALARNALSGVEEGTRRALVVLLRSPHLDNLP